MEGVYLEGTQDTLDPISKFPVEIVMKIFKEFSNDDLMNIREVSYRWNELACYVIEAQVGIWFNSLAELRNFSNWIVSQFVFDRVPLINSFRIEIDNFIMITPDNHVPYVVEETFAAVSHDIGQFHLNWGTVVRTWNCNMQVSLFGIPAPVLCQELITHMLHYFPNLKNLVLFVPMIDLQEDITMDRFNLATPITTRSSLHSIQLYIGEYFGEEAPSAKYIQTLQKSIQSLLSATTNLTTLKVIGGYHRQHLEIPSVLKNSANFFASTLITLILTPPMTIKQLNDLATVGFEHLQHLELFLIPGTNEGTSIQNFLLPCCDKLISLNIGFQRLLMSPELGSSNDMTNFPPKGFLNQMQRLIKLDLGGYIKGIVRLHMMPNLQTLCLDACKNLTFISNDPFAAAGNAPPSPLRHRLEELNLRGYVHTSPYYDHVILSLLSPGIRILRFSMTHFGMNGLMQRIFQTCTQLRELTIVNCEGLNISDITFCGDVPTSMITNEFLNEVVENGVRPNEELRAKAALLDTSSKDSGQISNLKELRRIIISSTQLMPLTDLVFFFGLSHLPKLESVIFDFRGNFTFYGRAIMQIMQPTADLTQVQFRMTI